MSGVRPENVRRRARRVALLSIVALVSVAWAQTDVDPVVRVGLVIPTQTGPVPVDASLYDIVGEAARMGALMAEDELGMRPDADGPTLDLLLASTPSAEAARRAAQRLAAVEEVRALVGGIGEGQAEAISEVAEAHGIVFLNIGSPEPDLRERCQAGRFHVEPSASMYLDAMLEWYEGQGSERWFIVHERSEDGEALHEVALQAFDRRYGDASRIVGAAEVEPGQPLYVPEVQEAEEASADTILLLLRAEDQIPFLAQQGSAGDALAIAPFPHQVTQTRDYMMAAAYESANPGAAHRLVSWETTLAEHGADELNERFISRWGRPLDPSGWNAYVAVLALGEALRPGSANTGDELMARLAAPQFAVEARKGEPLTFTEGDGQLVQPVYVVAVDSEAEWGRSVSRQLEVASLAGEVRPVHSASQGGGCD